MLLPTLHSVLESGDTSLMIHCVWRCWCGPRLLFHSSVVHAVPLCESFALQVCASRQYYLHCFILYGETEVLTVFLKTTHIQKGYKGTTPPTWVFTAVLIVFTTTWVRPHLIDFKCPLYRRALANTESQVHSSKSCDKWVEIFHYNDRCLKY